MSPYISSFHARRPGHTVEEGLAVTSALLSLIDFHVDNKVIETDDDGEETFSVNAAQIGIDP